MDAQDLPLRMVQVTHALLEALADAGGPVTAAEVQEYDGEAIIVQHTAGALAAAQRTGLAARTGPRHWTATPQAHEMRRALEDRVMS